MHVTIRRSATAALLVGALVPTTAYAHHDTRVHQVNLVSDQAGKAAIQDTSLVNAWGLSVAPNGASPIWVANNGTDSSTLYSGSTGAGASPFMKVPLTVSVAGAPTGTVFNASTGFTVSDGQGHSAPSRFLFATESGTILGWNPTVPPSSAMPPAPSTMAFVIASEKDAIYKGLTIASQGMSTWLYAADFHNNRIAVWNQSGTRLWWKGAFRDRKLPHHYAPFNIQELGGKLYVSYAKQDAAAEDEIAGAGRGFVDVYDVHGNLLKRLIHRGVLDAPWGLTIAPKGFGHLGGALLVGNFGNGRIHAYSTKSGKLLETLRASNGRPRVIDGLWALRAGDGTTGAKDQVLFTAGPDEESHGLFGKLVVEH